MDSIRASEAPDPGSIPGEATTPKPIRSFHAQSRAADLIGFVTPLKTPAHTPSAAAVVAITSIKK